MSRSAPASSLRSWATTLGAQCKREDSDVRPLCIHRLRHQPAQASTAEHGRRWRNGTTSIEQYSLALRSTKEKIIPPPLNQRVRVRVPGGALPHTPLTRFLRGTGQRHLDTRPVVYPSYVHRSATGLPAPAGASSGRRLRRRGKPTDGSLPTLALIPPRPWPEG